MSDNRQIAERFIASLEARDWEAWTGLLHPDVVYEIPQSRERIRGRDRYLRFNQEYPGDRHVRPKVVIADGLITRVTDFWPEPYEPPAGREHLVERW